MKIFLNICTEEAIPKPPETTEDALGRVIAAEDVKDVEAYFVPIVLSDVRDETDKGKRVITKGAVLSNPDFEWWYYLLRRQFLPGEGSMQSLSGGTHLIRIKGLRLCGTPFHAYYNGEITRIP